MNDVTLDDVTLDDVVCITFPSFLGELHHITHENCAKRDYAGHPRSCRDCPSMEAAWHIPNDEWLCSTCANVFFVLTALEHPTYTVERRKRKKKRTR